MGREARDSDNHQLGREWNLKRGILNCLEKRDLLNQSAVSVEMLREWGERFEQSGMLYDAVDFFKKAYANEALERLLDTAREDGDLFLYQKIAKILKIDPSRDEWISLGTRAEELGKTAFARQAYRLAGIETSAGAWGNGDLESEARKDGVTARTELTRH